MSTTRPVGDRVSVDHPNHPGVWIIKSVGPANYVLEPEGGGRPLRAPHSMVSDPDAAKATGDEVYYVPGELARIAEGKYAGLYVVLADKGNKVNVAKLGGDGGRYVRALRRSLVKVDPAEVLK